MVFSSEEEKLVKQIQSMIQDIDKTGKLRVRDDLNQDQCEDEPGYAYVEFGDGKEACVSMEKELDEDGTAAIHLKPEIKRDAIKEEVE